MKTWLKKTILASILALGLVANAEARKQYTPDSQPATELECKNDIVVWLNTNSGIYHLKGERWYGRTKNGEYICKKDAERAGKRETRNGQ